MHFTIDNISRIGVIIDLGTVRNANTAVDHLQQGLFLYAFTSSLVQRDDLHDNIERRQRTTSPISLLRENYAI